MTRFCQDFSLDTRSRRFQAGRAGLNDRLKWNSDRHEVDDQVEQGCHRFRRGISADSTSLISRFVNVRGLQSQGNRFRRRASLTENADEMRLGAGVQQGTSRNVMSDKSLTRTI